MWVFGRKSCRVQITRILTRRTKLIVKPVRYEANLLFVYEVNWKFRSEAGYEVNDACYDASHETDFEACRMLVMKPEVC